MVPGKIFKNVGVYAICVSAFMTRCSLLILTYYIVRRPLPPLPVLLLAELDPRDVDLHLETP